ncbi:MAG: NAD(P)-dependent oxidoreductase [Phaeodactylibacter sp.]|nr:NAD(P)-dependent oxidoreductase [Phaeodactylibacter sp.]
MQTIVVTGSSGQLGREVVRLLRRQGYQVIGIDLTESETTEARIDICDAGSVLDITRPANAIIHTAALHGKHFEAGYPRAPFIDTNIKGTLNLLNACVQNGIPKFLYTSTTSIYGKAMVDDKQAVWVTEKLTPQPRDIYDITKLAAELLCRDFFEKEQVETTVLRVSRFMPEPDNVKAIHRLYRGLAEEDGARAHLLALEKRFDRFEIFNVSNQSPFRENDLAELYTNPRSVITRYYPRAEAVFAERNWQFPGRIDRVYVIDKAVQMLGYRPRQNFDTFLA